MYIWKTRSLFAILSFSKILIWRSWIPPLIFLFRVPVSNGLDLPMKNLTEHKCEEYAIKYNNSDCAHLWAMIDVPISTTAPSVPGCLLINSLTMLLLYCQKKYILIRILRMWRNLDCKEERGQFDEKQIDIFLCM